jgi:hypothetical protein
LISRPRNPATIPKENTAGSYVKEQRRVASNAFNSCKSRLPAIRF